MFGASKTASGSNLGPSDPYYEYVTMLLTGDGTNGAQNNTFVDSSTNNFTITRNGNTTQGSFSPYGSNWGVNFGSSSTEVISVPASTDWDFGSGSFTMECWIFPTQNMTDSWIAAIYNSYTWNWRIATTNKLMFYWNNFGSSYTSTGTITLNQWNHIVLVSNGTTAAFFINGTRDSTNSAPNINNDSGTNPLYIGNALGGYDRRLYGELSNLRIVKGSAVYDPTQSTLTVPTSPLTAITNTKLLVLQSSRFIDNSSSNRTLTVTSGTTTPSIQRFSPFNPTVPYSTATIGGSGYFDGTGDYLSFASGTGFDVRTGDFTIEGWVYPNATGEYGVVGNLTNNNGLLQWCIFINHASTNKQLLFIYGTSASYTGNVLIGGNSGTLPINTWHHFAITRSGTTIRVFLNGAIVATDTTGNSFYNNNPNSFVIGANADASNPMVGNITDVRVIKGTALYTSAFTPPTAPLTAITNTSLLCNMTNAGIPDSAMMNDLETAGNAQVSTSVKKYGTGSLSFDGTGDYLKTVNGLPFNSLGSGQFTVEMWIYRNGNGSGGTSDYDAIIGTNNGAAAVWGIYVQRSTSKIGFYNSAGLFLTSSTISSTTWTHIAVSRDSSNNLQIFINGTSGYSASNTGTGTAVSPLYIAFDGTTPSGNNAFNGYIDDLRITNGYARYTANFTPPTTALPTY